MPPTDPRFLDAEEGQILMDLVLRLRVQQQAEGAGNEVVEALSRSEEAIEGMLQRKAAFLADPKVGDRLRAASGRSSRPQPTSLRVGAAEIKAR